MNDEVLLELPGGRVAGHFKIERFVGPIEDGICNGVWDFHNLILNTGLDYFCYAPAVSLDVLFSRCSVGTNNTAPAAGQTLLLGGVGSTTNVSDLGLTYVPGAAPYVERSFQYDFAVGAIVANIAEIGIGPGAYNVDPLVARALVLDGGGSPTVVSVLVTESLRVTYYIRNYILTTDAGGVVTIGGINYTYVVRASSWNVAQVTGINFPGLWGSASGKVDGSWVFASGINLTGLGVSGLGSIAAFSTQTLSTIDLYPANTGGAVGCGTHGAVAYIAGQYYRDDIITIGLTEANTLTGGIGAIVYGGAFGVYQMNFTPKLPKTNLNAFALRLRITISNYP